MMCWLNLLTQDSRDTIIVTFSDATCVKIMDPLELVIADTYDWAQQRIDQLLLEEKYQEASDLFEEFREWLVESDADHEIIYV